MIIRVRTYLARGLPAVVLAACAASTVRWLVHTLRAAAFPFPLDYGEGPLFDQAVRLLKRGSIYAPLGSTYPLTIANYPPIGPGLLATLRATGLHGWGPARGLIAVACVACAALVACLATAGKRSGAGAVLAAAMFLSCPSVFFWSCFVRVDFIALVWALASLLLATRRPQARSTPWLCAALAAAAAFSRQSYLLAAPAAVTATLLTAGERQAATFVTALAAVVSGTVLWMQFATKGGFWFHVVVANINPWHGDLARLAAMAWLAASGLLALALLSATRFERHDPVSVGTTSYFLAAIATSVLAAKEGASLNYFLELAAASSILVGREYTRAHVRGGVRASLLDSCLVFQVVVLMVYRPDEITAMDARIDDRRSLARVAARFEAEPRPILADEMMGLLAEQGRPILFQPFEFAELARAHVWDPSGIVRDIDNGTFGLIAIAGSSLSDEDVQQRWTKPMLDAIAEHYQLGEVLGGIMLWRPCPSAR